MSRGKALIYVLVTAYSRTTHIGRSAASGISPIVAALSGAEHKRMDKAERIHTYDDDLHERRRHLAIVREPIDFEAERLRRLQEKSRDTVNP